jgi:hypothetical protein
VPDVLDMDFTPLWIMKYRLCGQPGASEKVPAITVDLRSRQEHRYRSPIPQRSAALFGRRAIC